MALNAVFEVIGVASLMPFLAVLADPEQIHRQPVLSQFYAWAGFTRAEDFLILLGAGAFALLVLTAVVRSATLFVQNQFVQMRRHTLGCRLLAGYLAQPYEFFLNRHTGDLGKNILSEVDMFIDRALLPIGYVVSFGLVLLVMIAFLVAIQPLTALVIAVVLGTFYVIVYRIVRGILGRGGQARATANRTRFESATEALGGIKTLKVLGRETTYLGRFTGASEIVARNFALSAILGQIPKFVIETVAFGGIILAALVVLVSNGVEGSLGTLLPLLSLYALAGYRMLPAVQGVYQAISTLRFAAPAVDTIVRELDTLRLGQNIAPATTRLPLLETFELRDVTYSYPGSVAGLHGVTLTVRKGESLGIVGRTGSGKTTLVDVILGLLTPQSGSVLVDGVPLDAARRRAWQRSLGYVPQDIFLTDASLAENIAMGLAPGDIDPARVERAARIAHIHDFVMESLPDGYATRVGERGVRLSGGQRQRIGIARALYHDPEVIVFDEATSALDSLTESEVMEAIQTLSGTKTVILIAHRTGTLEACDRVVRLEGGRVDTPISRAFPR
ncbi:MAG TPA: ABC transporter ATP-binding protein [Hyphomonas sp.]|nr:ABC transporter ATP-binding protein [Hyphomonas sp.]